MLIYDRIDVVFTVTLDNANEIRKKHDIDKDVIVCGDVEKDKPTIEFRKKHNFKDLKGIVKLDYPVNSVELKKGLYNE